MADNDNLGTKSIFFARKVATFGDLSTSSGDELIEKINKAMERHQKVLAMGNAKLIERSKQEMEIVRQMVRNNTANVGETRDSVLRNLNNSIIQTETALVKMSDMQESTVAKVGESIKENLPSGESILGAISVANPVFGFVLSVTKDIANRSKEARAEASENAKKLESIIESGVENDEDLLEQINDNDNEEFLERLRGDDIVERLEMLHGSVKNQNKLLLGFITGESLVSDQILAQNKKVEAENRTSGLKFLESDSESIMNDMVNPAAGDANSKSSFLDNLLGLQVFGPLSAMFGAIGASIASVGSFIAAGLMGALRIITGPVGLFLGAAKLFSDGWIDAAEILGKDASEIDSSDRLAAGLGSIVGFIGDIIDWVTSLFGVTTNVGDFFERNTAVKLAEVFNVMQGWFTDFFEFIFETIPQLRGDLTVWIGRLGESISDFFTETVPEFFIDMFDGMIDGVTNMFNDGTDLLGDIGDFGLDIGKRVSDGIAALVQPYLPDKDGPLGFIYDAFNFWDNETPQPITPLNNQTTSTRLENLNRITTEVERMSSAQGGGQNNVVVAPSTSINNTNTTFQTPLSSRNGNNLFNQMNRFDPAR